MPVADHGLGEGSPLWLRLILMGALLLLWDIDHTLTENNGVNKEIYALAFEMLTGRPRSTARGRTDGPSRK